MGVVDVQVDRRSARAVGVADPARPVGLGDHPEEVRGLERPEPSRADGLGGEGELGEERQNMRMSSRSLGRAAACMASASFVVSA